MAADDRFKRAHARFPCSLKVSVFTGPVGGIALGAGEIINLSVSGCLLVFAGSLKSGASYRLRLEWQEGALDLPGRVARAATAAAGTKGSRHYGLAFNLTYDQEKALMRLVDLVRRHGDAPGEDRLGRSLRDYWS